MTQDQLQRGGCWEMGLGLQKAKGACSQPELDQKELFLAPLMPAGTAQLPAEQANHMFFLTLSLPFLCSLGNEHLGSVASSSVSE